MLNFLSPLLILTLVLPVPALAKERPKKRLVKIGVTQAISHPAYDLDAKGFEKALAEAGFKEGVNVTYFRQIAQGRRSQVEKIAQDFVNGRVDLVHSIGTLASQAAVRRIKHIPIVFSSAPYPIESGLVPKSRRPN